MESRPPSIQINFHLQQHYRYTKRSYARRHYFCSNFVLDEGLNQRFYDQEKIKISTCSHSEIGEPFRDTAVSELSTLLI